MNRRGFFAATVGLIMGACSDPNSRRRGPFRRRGRGEVNVSAVDVESFKEFLKVNEEKFKSIRKDIWSGQRRIW